MAANELSLNRRSLLKTAGMGAAAIGLGNTWPGLVHAQGREASIDHTIRIGHVSLELAPGKIVKTTAYMGRFLGLHCACKRVSR